MAALLSNIGPIPQQDARFYIVEMILAVASLHDMGYIHRYLLEIQARDCTGYSIALL
jgi:hypothetical protein